MGIVLPEGVLNNTNLQKVRDFVESRAKILLIVSIPQDVFMASGATVKPSLMFFKKFTMEEAKVYAEIKANAEIDYDSKYSSEISAINEKLSKKGKKALSKEEKNDLNARKKKILEQRINEVKSTIKEQFDYEIPIAEVQKAGISTTGAPIENELIPLAEEFTPYRKKMVLWTVPSIETTYSISEDGILSRIRSIDGVPFVPEVFYKDSER